MLELGCLKQVELRNIWENEAQHFTPWLAAEENLSVLADTLQMDLEFVAQEMDVGQFRADILCRNADGGSWVLIENQLERTNHSHLGQLLTYAAGLHWCVLTRSTSDRPQRSSRQTRTRSISRRLAAAMSFSRWGRVVAPEPHVLNLDGNGPMPPLGIVPHHRELHGQCLLVVG